MKKLLALLLVFLLLTGCTVPAGTVPGEGFQPAQTQPESGLLKVHFMDVGQADGILLEYDGQFVLIDGGYPDTGAEMVAYMQEQGVEELALVIATHAHGDHLGAIPHALRTFDTQRVWCPTTYYSSYYFESFCQILDQKGLTMEMPRIGEKFFLGDVSLTVLGPLDRYENENNNSIVVMVQYGENKFLLTGDMQREAEADLVESGVDLKADVLKVGHHGSYTSSSYLFLREVMPAYGVISCGRNNEYGHPHSDPMSRLRDAGVDLYRTDRMGTIVCTSDGQNISFSWEFQDVPPEIND